MKNKNLTKFLLGEEDSFDMDDIQYDSMDTNTFQQKLVQLNQLKDTIYRTKGLKDAISKIKEIVDIAQEFIKKDTEDWFDDVTVKRHTKFLADAEKAFNKAAQDNVQTQMRLEAAFEDIMSILGKYYDVQ